MMVKRIVLLLLLGLGFGVGPALAESPGPIDQVRATADAIIALLNDPALAPAVRRQRITSIIRSKFHFPSMSQAVLAVNWRKATPEQRKRFTELFSELLETTYRGRIEAYIDEYTDERVDYLKETVDGRRAVVDTLVITRTADIPVSYKMIPVEGEWLVYDVEIEGISLVRNYRSSYGEIVRKEGLQGLLRRMEEKIVELRAGQPGQSSGKKGAVSRREVYAIIELQEERKLFDSFWDAGNRKAAHAGNLQTPDSDMA